MTEKPIWGVKNKVCMYVCMHACMYVHVCITSKITITDSACKTHVCMYCREKQLKLSRHLKRKHKDEATVADAMALKDGSSKAFERIRLRGDYHHNISALGEGEMIVMRNPATKHPSNA